MFREVRKLIDLVPIIPLLVLFIVLVRAKDFGNSEAQKYEDYKNSLKPRDGRAALSCDDVRYIDWMSRRFGEGCK